MEHWKNKGNWKSVPDTVTAIVDFAEKRDDDRKKHKKGCKNPGSEKCCESEIKSKQKVFSFIIPRPRLKK